MKKTPYYDEFLRYYQLADTQQRLCNLGSVPYLESGVSDDLMENVELYDVTERKYAGFSAIINDAWYGWTPDHPYWSKMSVGNHTHQREAVAKAWTGKRDKTPLEYWLYLFILHRVCGSGINYSQKPSGYHNTLLFNLHVADTIEEMAEIVNLHPKPFYTSVGYQFPAFPKPPTSSSYKRGGDYYLTEFAPRLARDLVVFLESGEKKKDLRVIGDWMLAWNVQNGLRQYKFQYAAVVADIADWMPEFVNKNSPFYYGSNAVECISSLVEGGARKTEDLDKIMFRIMNDTGGHPYNAEDVCCDYIRWVENYIKPGSHYDYLDFDKIWSSCQIADHPFGRQRAMLDLGLVKTFNGMKAHPSDDKVLRDAEISVEDYKKMCTNLQNVVE